MLPVFKELYYVANDQKMADKKKADYQEDLENSCADSAARSRDSYTKARKKSCTKPQKLHEGSERVVLTVQHEATKVTRTTWRRVT